MYAEAQQDGDFSAVRVAVRFSRRYEFYVLTLYIPTTLLILTAYTTFYFNPAIFQPRIIVALTALLVLSSLFTQVMTWFASPSCWPRLTETRAFRVPETLLTGR